MKKLIILAICAMAFLSATTVTAEEAKPATIKCKVGEEIKDVADEKACTDLGGTIEKAEKQ